MEFTSQTKTKISLWSKLLEKIRKSDWKLLIPYLLLVVFGVLMVYSSSSYFAMMEKGNSEHFFIRQAIYAALGVSFGTVVSLLSNRFLKSKPIISTMLMGLLVVMGLLLIVGRATNGAKGWIYIGPIGIQPVEILKLVLILYLGIFAADNQNRMAQLHKQVKKSYQHSAGLKKSRRLKQAAIPVWKALKSPLLCFGIFLLLIALQPDMGGAIIVALIGLLMFLHSGISIKISIGLLSVLGFLYAAFIGTVRIFGSIPFLPEYQVQRFTAFLDPFADVKDSSFQLVNSFYALARGGTFGVGLGESVQKSGYLPESYTDFIISIIGEELGLLGIMLVLTVFFYMVYRIYRSSMKIRDCFGQMVCIGIASMFLIQAVINVGGATGLLPLTGVTFPFISYGGSSMMINCTAIGVVNNIWINERRQREMDLLKEMQSSVR